MNKQYYTYIMGNDRPTLYIGVTNNLVRRVYEHKQGTVDGFTKQYELKKLLYYEIHSSIEEAILREKRMKTWQREWKLNLIRTTNAELKDLYESIVG